MKFNSQICTSREQSERLLALGLKKETADMHHYLWSEGFWDIQACPPRGNSSSFIPAWSLHRLIEMMPECLTFYGDLYYISIREHQVKYVKDVSEDFFGCWGGYTLYDKVINCIEWLIKEGDFNKEYLQEQADSRREE